MEKKTSRNPGWIRNGVEILMLWIVIAAVAFIVADVLVYWIGHMESEYMQEWYGRDP